MCLSFFLQTKIQITLVATVQFFYTQDLVYLFIVYYNKNDTEVT